MNCVYQHACCLSKIVGSFTPLFSQTVVVDRVNCSRQTHVITVKRCSLIIKSELVMLKARGNTRADISRLFEISTSVLFLISEKTDSTQIEPQVT